MEEYPAWLRRGDLEEYLNYRGKKVEEYPTWLQVVNELNFRQNRRNASRIIMAFFHLFILIFLIYSSP